MAAYTPTFLSYTSFPIRKVKIIDKIKKNVMLNAATFACTPKIIYRGKGIRCIRWGYLVLLSYVSGKFSKLVGWPVNVL
jgi:hypothetical protein